jgi:hypothetical protein
MERISVRIALFTLVLLILGCTSTDSVIKSQPPSTLNEAVSRLQSTLPQKDLNTLKSGTEQDLHKYHHGFGTGLRNSWGLWSNSKLSNWFNDKGIHHPDDMSSIIIMSLYRELNGLPWEVEKQIGIYKAYWEETKALQEKEALLDIERQKRRKTAMLGWSWKTISAPEVLLPKQPDNKDVWGLEPYENGFIVTLKGWRKEPKSVWHDGIYFINVESKELKPVTIQGCPEIHDVIVREKVAQWLCKDNDDWTLITTEPSTALKRLVLKLPTQAEWLRLGKSNDGLLIISQDSIFELKSDTPNQIYQAKSSQRQYPIFDSDGIGNQKEGEFFFPQRSATPLLFDGAVYFQVEDSGNETDLYRMKLSAQDLEGADDIFVYDYIGGWSVNVSSLAIDNKENLWLGTPRKGTLVKLTRGDDIKFASLFNSLTPLEEITTDHQKDWRELLPTGAILFSDETLYLASSTGIVSVKNGEITPIVYFVYPDGMERTPYTSSPQYGYHIKPQRLGKFEDGSFIIGDRFDGVYLLLKNGKSHEFFLPIISEEAHHLED